MVETGLNCMVIKVNIETGEVEPPLDENGRPASEVDFKNIEEIYKSPNGFKHIGLILHAHSSPGCVYAIIGGKAYRICR
jgi:hypothetical protein